MEEGSEDELINAQYVDENDVVIEVAEDESSLFNQDENQTTGNLETRVGNGTADVNMSPIIDLTEDCSWQNDDSGKFRSMVESTSSHDVDATVTPLPVRKKRGRKPKNQSNPEPVVHEDHVEPQQKSAYFTSSQQKESGTLCNTSVEVELTSSHDVDPTVSLVPVKRKRGRPKKHTNPEPGLHEDHVEPLQKSVYNTYSQQKDESETLCNTSVEVEPTSSHDVDPAVSLVPVKRKRGRPKKQTNPETGLHEDNVEPLQKSVYNTNSLQQEDGADAGKLSSTVSLDMECDVVPNTVIPNMNKNPDKKSVNQTQTEDVLKDNDIEHLRRPFLFGWTRELVYRNQSQTAGTNKDVYYTAPNGKKLRSKVDVATYLASDKNSRVNISHFSFARQQLFSPPYETVRLAGKNPHKRPPLDVGMTHIPGSSMSRKAPEVDVGISLEEERKLPVRITSSMSAKALLPKIVVKKLSDADLVQQFGVTVKNVDEFDKDTNKKNMEPNSKSVTNPALQIVATATVTEAEGPDNSTSAFSQLHIAKKRRKRMRPRSPDWTPKSNGFHIKNVKRHNIQVMKPTLATGSVNGDEDGSSDDDDLQNILGTPSKLIASIVGSEPRTAANNMNELNGTASHEVTMEKLSSVTTPATVEKLSSVTTPVDNSSTKSSTVSRFLVLTSLQPTPVDSTGVCSRNCANMGGVEPFHSCIKCGQRYHLTCTKIDSMQSHKSLCLNCIRASDSSDKMTKFSLTQLKHQRKMQKLSSHPIALHEIGSSSGCTPLPVVTPVVSTAFNTPLLVTTPHLLPSALSSVILVPGQTPTALPVGSPLVSHAQFETLTLLPIPFTSGVTPPPPRLQFHSLSNTDQPPPVVSDITPPPPPPKLQFHSLPTINQLPPPLAHPPPPPPPLLLANSVLDSSSDVNSTIMKLPSLQPQQSLLVPIVNPSHCGQTPSHVQSGGQLEVECQSTNLMTQVTQEAGQLKSSAPAVATSDTSASPGQENLTQKGDLHAVNAGHVLLLTSGGSADTSLGSNQASSDVLGAIKHLASHRDRSESCSSSDSLDFLPVQFQSSNADSSTGQKVIRSRKKSQGVSSMTGVELGAISAVTLQQLENLQSSEGTCNIHKDMLNKPSVDTRRQEQTPTGVHGGNGSSCTSSNVVYQQSHGSDVSVPAETYRLEHGGLAAVNAGNPSLSVIPEQRTNIPGLKPKLLEKKAARRAYLSSFRVLHGSFPIVTKIFGQLSVVDLLRVSCVCRLWHILAMQSSLWKHVHLGGVQVRSWEQATQFFHNVGVTSLTLSSDVLEPSERVTSQGLWANIMKTIPTLTRLEKLFFHHVPSSVLNTITEKMPNLTNVGAQFIVDSHSQNSAPSPAIEKTVDSMRYAVEAVTSKKLSVRDAAKLFHVSEKDLIHMTQSAGRLTSNEQRAVMLCCLRLSRMGFSIQLTTLVARCQEMFARRFATTCAIPVSESYIRELYTCNAPLFTPDHEMATNFTVKQKLESHYSILQKLYKFLCPRLDPSPSKILCFDLKHFSVDKNLGFNNLHSVSITVFSAMAANLTNLPVMAVWPKYVDVTHTSLMNIIANRGLPSDHHVYNYFQKVLSLVKIRPLVIVCNGNASLFSEKFVSSCVTDGVYLYCVPPDVVKYTFPGFHGGLLHLLKSIVPEQGLSCEHFASILLSVLNKKMMGVQQSVKLAFTATGLSPFNPKAPSQYQTASFKVTQPVPLLSPQAISKMKDVGIAKLHKSCMASDANESTMVVAKSHALTSSAADKNRTRLTETNTVTDKNRTRLTETNTVTDKNRTSLTETNTVTDKNRTRLTETNTVTDKNRTPLTETNTVTDKNRTRLTETNTVTDKNRTRLTETNTVADKNRTRLTEISMVTDEDKTENGVAPAGSIREKRAGVREIVTVTKESQAETTDTLSSHDKEIKRKGNTDIEGAEKMDTNATSDGIKSPPTRILRQAKLKKWKEMRYSYVQLLARMFLDQAKRNVSVQAGSRNVTSRVSTDEHKQSISRPSASSTDLVDTNTRTVAKQTVSGNIDISNPARCLQKAASSIVSSDGTANIKTDGEKHSRIDQLSLENCNSSKCHQTSPAQMPRRDSIKGSRSRLSASSSSKSNIELVSQQAIASVPEVRAASAKKLQNGANYTTVTYLRRTDNSMFETALFLSNGGSKEDHRVSTKPSTDDHVPVKPSTDGHVSMKPVTASLSQNPGQECQNVINKKTNSASRSESVVRAGDEDNTNNCPGRRKKRKKHKKHRVKERAGEKSSSGTTETNLTNSESACEINNTETIEVQEDTVTSSKEVYDFSLIDHDYTVRYDVSEAGSDADMVNTAPVSVERVNVAGTDIGSKASSSIWNSEIERIMSNADFDFMLDEDVVVDAEVSSSQCGHDVSRKPDGNISSSSGTSCSTCSSCSDSSSSSDEEEPPTNSVNSRHPVQKTGESDENSLKCSYSSDEDDGECSTHSQVDDEAVLVASDDDNSSDSKQMEGKKEDDEADLVASDDNSSDSKQMEGKKEDDEDEDDEDEDDEDNDSEDDEENEVNEENEDDESLCQICMRSAPPHSRDKVIDWVDCDKNCGRWFHVICVTRSQAKADVKSYVCPSCRYN